MCNSVGSYFQLTFFVATGREMQDSEKLDMLLQSVDTM